MFKDDYLIDHLDTKQSLTMESIVFIELNQNDPTNVDTLGVFKFGEYQDETKFQTWPISSQYYRKHQFATSYMKKDILEEEIVYFGRRPKSDYFNLADCFTEFRPRSGILKAVMPATKDQVYVDGFKSVNRPRYYFPSIKDDFKYWTSWGTDPVLKKDIGLSSQIDGSMNNTAPFIVYKDARPANKVTVKIQTGMGLSRVIGGGKSDPLSDLVRSSIPEKWKVQYLDVAGHWQDIHIFETYDRAELPPETGTVDFGYVIKNPVEGQDLDFVFKGYVPTDKHLPAIARNGDGFCVGATKSNIGDLWIYDGEWVFHGPIEREWKIVSPDENPENYAINNYVNPDYYNPTSQGDWQDGFNQYDEFVMVQGLRVVVTKMFAKMRSFDLIELSPRLLINITDSVVSYGLDKAIAEDSTLPVGELSATTGSIVVDNSRLMFNTEQEFDGITGKGSLLADRINKNTKVLIYEVVRGVKRGYLLYDYIIPIKTMYVMEKPVVVSGLSEATIDLRDLIFRFEEASCPSLVLKDCSLSKAVATILDNIGFTNYMFEFPNAENGKSANKTIIPYFFITEDMKVAEVLQALAKATQSAMFFDEYNNFVVVPREHFGVEPTYTLRGQDEGSARANIEEINSITVDMIADAEIKYTVRQLARYPYGPNSLNSTAANTGGRFVPGEEGSFLGYKQAQLWNASEVTDTTTLSSAVLVTPLDALPPTYNPSVPEAYSHTAMDVGYWANNMPFQGMVMMNGEIIKYDAKQVVLQGTPFWATSYQHYQEMIGNVSFRQTDTFDQIGPFTGLLRIWTDIETDDSGNLKIIRHGRGMYNTPITNHPVSPIDWIGNGPAVFHKDSAYNTLFSRTADTKLANYSFAKKAVSVAAPTLAQKLALPTITTNYIYNPMHSTFSPLDANPVNIPNLEAPDMFAFQLRQKKNPLLEKKFVRSSSLTFGGNKNASANVVFKKYKTLKGTGYSVFGCRMGIVGIKSVLDSEDENKRSDQSPDGAMTLNVHTTGTGAEAKTQTIEGAGGGMFFRTLRYATTDSWTKGSTLQNNDGYYFEITALNGQYNQAPEDTTGLGEYIFPNVNFYKINYGEVIGPYDNWDSTNVAVPLFSSYMPIGVTTGSMVNRNRIYTAESVVYDLAVDVRSVVLERQTILKFYLYVNDTLIGVASDSLNTANGYVPPRRIDNTEMGIFVRGRSTVQFEHIYAVGANESERIPRTFDTDIFRRLPEFRVYSPSAIWSTQALTGGPENLWRYYDEFGSIAREVKKVEAKFNMYPAFLPSIATIRTVDKAYTATHYEANPYKASFMLWSQADDNIVFGDETNLQLVIKGLTFADNQEQSLKLDDYLLGRVDGVAPEDKLNLGLERRNELLAKRLLGQTTSLEFDSMYIQSTEYAKKLMDWLDGFIGNERVRLEVKAFGIPHLQLGDIVSVDYDIPYLAEGEDEPTDDWNPTLDSYTKSKFKFYGSGKRFIIRKISLDRSDDGPDYTLSLVEMPSKASWDAGVW